MATQEQLKTHIEKAKSKLADAVKKAGDKKYDKTVRELKKKAKRLARKSAKFDYMEAMKLKKQNKKKGGEAAA